MFEAKLLKGKSFLVTGGSSGLGLAMAHEFASLGANVAICGRTKEKLDAAKDRLVGHGTTILALQVDVRDFSAVEKMIAECVAEFGELSGLVNNAAGNFLCPSEELSENGFNTVIDIVLRGSFNCSRHFGRYLIDNSLSGSILNIVTTYTESGSAFVLPSACAKAGVYAMTTSLAFEWATYGIRVNAIAPGPIPTPGAWSRLVPSADLEKVFRERHPMKRFGTPEELAHLATFLMSEMATYITGECVTMDGGERLSGGQFNFIANTMPRDELNKMMAEMKQRK